MQRTELVTYLDSYLRIAEIKDYGPQGLQIEGRAEVRKIVGMVDAQAPCVAAALARGADMLLVHHGIFWGPPQRLVGSFGALVRAYLDADLNLYAAHLALDAHPEVGNNVELARRLGLTVESMFAPVNGMPIGVLASAPDGMTFDALVARYARNVGPAQLVQAYGPAVCHRVGIISGAAAREIPVAAGLGCDVFVTGETSHAEFYAAQNAGVNVIYGGHYVTETVGVQALGAHLSERFGIDFEFVDMPTGL
ncbi:MAG TPA: Nif3-like dinuclear metal center hexameric protein [Chloroflexi bacterium]|nr:Nif3-like dinuclear metal center hexameric protein [Chloroflexota bacterium]